MIGCVETNAMMTEMAAVPLATFKESSQGPWGLGRPSPTNLENQTRSTVCVKHPTVAIGSISSVNAHISEIGLPGINTLPTQILDLYPPPNISGSEEESDDVVESNFIPPAMAHKKRNSARIDKAYKVELQNTKASTSKSIWQENKCADTQLIELATYPGYSSDMPTTLPHNLDTLEQMKKVTRAHPKLTSKLENYREAWQQLFYSLRSQDIFLDYYWWFFLQHYQAELYPSIQDALFSRISRNYVRLLCEPVEIRWRDSFFRMYPDAIAQCAYSTFVCGYPNSWNNFDNAFRNELCLYISLWQVGTRPMPGLWKKWNLSLLEPPNMLKHRGQDVNIEDAEASVVKRSPRTFKGLLMPNLLAEKHRRRSEVIPRSKMLLEKHRRSEIFPRGKILPELVAHGQIFPPLLPSSQKSMSFVEDKMTLACFKETLVPFLHHSEKSKDQATMGVVPSGSEEMRIKMARNQFKTLEKRTLGLPQPSYSESQQNGHSRTVTSSVNFDLNTVLIRPIPKSESSMRRPLNWQAVKKDGFIPQAQQVISSNTHNTLHSDICFKSRPVMAKRSVSLVGEMEKRNASGDIKPYKSSISKSTVQDTWHGTLSSSTSTTTDTYQQKCIELKRMALAFEEKLKGDESAPSIKGPEFEHVLFNLHGHSPLVKHYINHTKLTQINEKESIVGRTEIIEKEPGQALCYQAILAKSKRTSDRNHAMFQKYYKLQKHLIAEAHKRRLAEHHKHEENMKMVLSNKREVQQLSSELSFRAFYQPVLQTTRTKMRT